jgi:hypothetical protein
LVFFFAPPATAGFPPCCPGGLGPHPPSWPYPAHDANALGAIARVGIRNQDGTDLITPFDVSLGRHRLIDVDLKGAVQVQITCTGRDSKTGKGRSYFYVVLGNGALHA